MVSRLKLLPLGALVFALSACSTAPQNPITLVPVETPCNVTMPTAPVWATDLLPPGSNVFEKAKAALAELIQRAAYEDLLIAAVESCHE